MPERDKAQEGLITSITQNLRQFEKDFEREAESCQYYGKLYTFGCHNPNCHNIHCNWETCPLR